MRKSSMIVPLIALFVGGLAFAGQANAKPCRRLCRDQALACVTAAREQFPCSTLARAERKTCRVARRAALHECATARKAMIASCKASPVVDSCSPSGAFIDAR